jgi:hypothetical protein
VDEDGGGGDGWSAVRKKAIQSFRLRLRSGPSTLLGTEWNPLIARKDAMEGHPIGGRFDALVVAKSQVIIVVSPNCVAWETVSG